MDHDGIYQVGRDILPGLWHSDGPRTPAAPCHFEERMIVHIERQVMTVNVADVPGAFSITINPKDDSFLTKGCQPWHLVKPLPEDF